MNIVYWALGIKSFVQKNGKSAFNDKEKTASAEQ